MLITVPNPVTALAIMPVATTSRAWSRVAMPLVDQCLNAGAGVTSCTRFEGTVSIFGCKAAAVSFLWRDSITGDTDSSLTLKVGPSRVIVARASVRVALRK